MSKVYSSLEEFENDYQYDLSNKSSYLGGGRYGDVWKGYDIHNNKLVAIKIGADLLKEFEAAKSLKHKNIAHYEACYRISDKKAGTKDYAIMQLYPEGNLSQLLRKNILSIDQKKEIIKGILEGLEYMHASKRIHRDFKPSNILIAINQKGNYIPLIADFGLTKIVNEKDLIDGSDIELSDGRGTASYKAPEQVLGSKAHYNLDLWAFGVILYEMLTGELPFQKGRTKSEQSDANIQLERIKNVELPEKLNTIEQPFQAMIRRCLIKDIHVRVRNVEELNDILDEISEKIKIATENFNSKNYIESKNQFAELIKIRPKNILIESYLTKIALTEKNTSEYFVKYDAAILNNEFKNAELFLNEILLINPNNERALIEKSKFPNTELTDLNPNPPKTSFFEKLLFPFLQSLSLAGFLFSLFGIYSSDFKFNSNWTNWINRYSPTYNNSILTLIGLISISSFLIYSIIVFIRDRKKSKRKLIEFISISCFMFFAIICYLTAYQIEKKVFYGSIQYYQLYIFFEKTAQYYYAPLIFAYLFNHFKKSSKINTYDKLSFANINQFYQWNILNIFLPVVFLVTLFLNFGNSILYILLPIICIYYIFQFKIYSFFTKEKIIKPQFNLLTTILVITLIYIFSAINFNNAISKFTFSQSIVNEFYPNDAFASFEKLTWIDGQIQKFKNEDTISFWEGYSEVQNVGNYFYRANNGDKYAFLDYNGKPLTAFKYDEIGYMSGADFLIPAKLGDLWGYLDHTGVEIIKCQFIGEVTIFQNGKAKVYPSGSIAKDTFFEIDRNGNKL